MRLRVVGVVGNTRDSIEDDATPKIYLPYRQFLSELRAMLLAVQTTTSATNLVGTIRAEASAMDDRMIIDRIRTMDAIRRDLVSERRFSTLVLGIFAAVALLLSAAGVYSVMAYSINRRTAELGIRKALGARPQELVRMVLGHGLRLIGVGLVLGLSGAFFVTRVLSNQLWVVTATDPLTVGAMAALLLAVGGVACYLPARRATRVDPTVALRHE